MIYLNREMPKRCMGCPCFDDYRCLCRVNGYAMDFGGRAIGFWMERADWCPLKETDDDKPWHCYKEGDLVPYGTTRELMRGVFKERDELLAEYTDRIEALENEYKIPHQVIVTDGYGGVDWSLPRSLYESQKKEYAERAKALEAEIERLREGWMRAKCRSMQIYNDEFATSCNKCDKCDSNDYCQAVVDAVETAGRVFEGKGERDHLAAIVDGMDCKPSPPLYGDEGKCDNDGEEPCSETILRRFGVDILDTRERGADGPVYQES